MRPFLKHALRYYQALTVCSALMFALGASICSGQIRFLISDLGTLDGYTLSAARAINNKGEVVGFSYANDNSEAFLYKNGKMLALGTLGYSRSTAVAINNNSQVVVVAGSRSFLYSDGTMTDVGGFEASDINDAGQIVGTLTVGGWSVQKAIIWNNGTTTTLRPDFAQATGINSRGQVTGQTFSRAFIYTPPGTIIDLGSLSGDHSFAMAINDEGQVVGKSDIAPVPPLYLDDFHAFLYRGGTMIDLGTLGTHSVALDINSAGEAVGYYVATNGNQRAFIYMGGMTKDLNDLVDRSSGWTVFQASEINDNGWIAAIGKSASGNTRALLLTPLPQLTSIASQAGILIKWPTDAVGFALESNTNLFSPVWTPVTNRPVVVNGENVISNEISGALQFFRLRR